jgi:hypothetical protein
MSEGESGDSNVEALAMLARHVLTPSLTLWILTMEVTSESESVLSSMPLFKATSLDLLVDIKVLRRVYERLESLNKRQPLINKDKVLELLIELS